ncbi:hypothetical protein ACJMK2_033178 [Sinanodonta woodiana]|uniref:Uncharacterized protein n=1 Tax=Sinanodonta woodiana TaxID=1069815 RepID=A0ABD3X4K9_SINWO
MNLIGFLLWRQRRKIDITKGGIHQSIALHDLDPGLYLTPISLEPPLLVFTCQERKTGHSNMAQKKTLDPYTLSTHVTQMISMDGYEVIDISYEDPEITPEQEEIMHDSTGNCITTYNDTSGYLTVLARNETTV